VRKGKVTGLATGATALAVGVIAAAAPAGSAAAKAPTAGPAAIVVKSGVVHPMGGMPAPSQANCVQNGYYHCLTPQQVETAYNLAPLYRHGVTGKGETIVIVDSLGSPTIMKDLAVFDRQFKLPAPPSFRIIAPAGKIPKWSADNSDMTGWGGETTLDVEYAHAIAPGASILLVETPVSETEGVTGFPQIVEAENYVLEHRLGDVISQSFSATEQTFTGLGQINRYHLRSAYVQAATEKDGPTVLAASGDSGAADAELDGSTYYTRRVTSWPDSDPLVTGVGGTELVAGKGGTYTSVAWNDTYDPHLGDGKVPFATGGGRSVLFSRPSYQDGAESVAGSARGVPDVSMNGACSSPVFTYQSFPQKDTPAGWYPACGTSEATPEFAGIVALADQVAGHALGVINPTLYRLSAAKAPGIVPVTSGNNTVTFVQGKPAKTYTIQGFTAQAGYSLVDGVGTVNAWYLVYELAGQTPPDEAAKTVQAS
jgi:subtilase family serine protease